MCKRRRNNMKWYEYVPSDTLFLRGSEPMESGTSFETTQVFPPSVSVIAGAVRTAVLAQQQVSIGQYKQGNSIWEKIGKFGEKAPFKILGPLLKNRDSLFAPAPFTWFTENKFTDSLISVKDSKALDKDIKKRLGVKSSSPRIGWTKHHKEVKSVGGSWVDLHEMLKGSKNYENGRTIFLSGDSDTRLFSLEERTGIAMDSTRNVVEGRIYTARHIRLKPDVSLVWGIDNSCGLASQGVLSLGGEQRFGQYREMDEMEDMLQFPETENSYLALSPVRVTKETSQALIASGKIIYRGGWDLAKQFHKDMVGFYPAGAVFTDNVDDLCVPFI
jgi:CRISPR-associated protein Cmr3